MLGGDGTFGSPNTGWPRYNRVAAQSAPYVGPGQVSWFQFTIQAPMTSGAYKLYLRPMIEGATWMEDYGVFWHVNVLNPDGTYAPRPAEPGCRDWPKELGTLMSKLPLPDQLCLEPYDPNPCPSIGGCYQFKTRYGSGNPPVFFDWPRNSVNVNGQYAGTPAEPHIVAHETCHAYQHRLSSDAGHLHFASWEVLPVGLEFQVAWLKFKTFYPEAFRNWFGGERSQSFENGAEVCAGWYVPYQTSQTALWPPLAEWAQKWLPK
jgi:hypothetical protein